MTTYDIINAMNGSEAVSVIRCGDGEKVILDNGIKADEHYMRIFGYIPKEKKEIRQHLIEAIRGCDILGIPRHKNLSRMEEDWRDVEKTIDELIPGVTGNRCSVDVHYDLLDGGYEQFLTGKSIALIGCRDLTEKISKRFNATVQWFEVAPEIRFTSYSGDRHYPYQFYRAKDWMENWAFRKDKILLVGAGILGKTYCTWWKQMGGKALDIGSVMDEWAGWATRGPGRGLDKQVKTKWTL